MLLTALASGFQGNIDKDNFKFKGLLLKYHEISNKQGDLFS